MLELFARHGGFGLSVKCTGDIKVDGHHSVEDIGIVLGQCFKEALGDKRGIKRYGSIALPMDESLARVNLDICSRPLLVYNVEGLLGKCGEFDVQLLPEFLQAFANNAGITLHVNLLYGSNNHHIIEAIFKALGRALGKAVKIVSDEVSSTKGVL
jgi:imidazoleglycerol-phosphate dehydratase